MKKIWYNSGDTKIRPDLEFRQEVQGSSDYTVKGFQSLVADIEEPEEQYHRLFTGLASMGELLEGSYL